MEGNYKKAMPYLSGLCAGLLNGLLGAGGGMVTVSILSRYGLEPKKAHATSVAIILPICILSAIIYIYNGKVTPRDAYPYLLWGVLGSVAGSFILSRINENLLRIIFGAVIIFSGFKMLVR